MLYLARILHSPEGELRNCVVRTSDGVVVQTQPFSGEMPSMLLVDEILLSPAGAGGNEKVAHGEQLYAFTVLADGSLQPLE